MAQRLNIDIVARDKSKEALGRLQGSLAKVKASVFNLKNAFIGLGAGLVIRGIVNAGMQIEELGVQLEALFGSAKKGKEALDAVTKFAKTTPFELSNIQQGVTALATVAEKAESLGISFDELLKITGNTAVQLGGDFALASQQIQRSFSAGIGSADLFRDKAVTAMAGFSAGVKTSVDDSIKGLAKAFGTGGKFGELTNKLANTLSGTISNLKDAFFTIQTEIASGFFAELKKELGDLKTFTEENDRAIRDISRNIGEALSVAVVSVADGIKFLADNFKILIELFKVFIALKVIQFFHNLALAIGVANTAMLGFNASVRKNLLIGGAVLVISQLGNIINLFKKLTGATKEAKEEMQSFNDIVGGADANEGHMLEKLESSLQIIHDFEHELSVAIPTATEKAIQKFKELNQGSLKSLEDKVSNIRMTIAEGINSGITKMSESLAQAFVMGEKLSATFANMARTFLVKVLSTLIEIVARKTVELAIEKLITKEKQKQASLSGGSGLFSFASSFFGGKASGGSVQKGQPYMVGEQGAELFIPNQSGQIQQSARGANGGSTTVNFNINTVDASGFDELLVRNRGTITALINNAVNERGSKNLI